MPESFQKVKLLNITDAQKQGAGDLFLYFSHIEWLVANIIWFCKISAQKYKETKDLPIAQEYFHAILGLNAEKKLDLLKELNFDISALKKVQVYRNTLAHGIIFNEAGKLVVKRLAKKQRVKFSVKEIMENVEILQNEGGKLLNFLRSRGYALK